MALIDLRKCLLAREYPSLEEKISACVAIQAEGAETNMGKDEILGRAKTRDCLEGLRVAVEEVKNKSEDFGHPSEGLLEVRLTEAEKLELLDLPEVVAGKEMLERIRNTRKELQIGLTVTQYADFINLAEVRKRGCGCERKRKVLIFFLRNSLSYIDCLKRAPTN